MEPEVVPASPVGVQTALVVVSTATVVAIETSLPPDGGSCVVTATSPIRRTAEEEHHTGVRGTREKARPGGEEVDPGRVVVTT